MNAEIDLFLSSIKKNYNNIILYYLNCIKIVLKESNFNLEGLVKIN